MKIQIVKKEDFEKFYELEKQFAQINRKIVKENIFRYYIPKTESKQDFLERLKRSNKYFYFVEENGKVRAYLYGYLKDLPEGYGTNRIGYIAKMFVSSESCGKGYSTLLKNDFIKWLKSKKVKYCWLDVSVDNKIAFSIFKKWKFKPFEYKMIKKI